MQYTLKHMYYNNSNTNDDDGGMRTLLHMVH